jgi:hypothetical protein
MMFHPAPREWPSQDTPETPPRRTKATAIAVISQNARQNVTSNNNQQ